MADHSKTAEPIAAGLKRLVNEEISSASRTLIKHGESKRDEAIHEARKSIKKVRGALRMVRPLLGKAYSKENDHLRKLSHELADFRDAAALLGVFDQLCGKNAGNLDAKSVQAMREGLELDKQELESSPQAAEVLQRVAETLDEAGERVNAWHLEVDRIDSLAPGLKKTYRSGRRALKAARKQAHAESYHDFRKRVKDRWHQAKLLKDIGPDGAQAEESTLKQLGAWLGDDHNLAMLRDRLKSEPKRYGGARSTRPFLAIVAREQEQLRQDSLSAGQELFRDKPSVYLRRIAECWQSTAVKKPAAKAESQKRLRKLAG